MRLAAAIFGLGVLALAANAEAGTLTIRFENDLFYKADREYTSGQGFTWTEDANSDPLANDLARWLPQFPRGAEVRGSFALNQAIYTPNNTAAVNPPPGQRPYAGWLYGQYGVDAQTDTRLSQYALQVGVVGPWALGEEAQNFVHRLRGFALANGWHYQLHNEAGIVLSDQQSWRYGITGEAHGFGIDVIPHAGFVAGNIYDYADVGGLVRIGLLTRDWSPARIAPSVPGTNVVDEDGGVYAFAGVEGRAVLRNIFLDGNSFESSRNVSKFPFVGEAELGAAATIGRFRVTYTHVFLSREYHTQGVNHQYGTVSVSMRF